VVVVTVVGRWQPSGVSRYRNEVGHVSTQTAMRRVKKKETGGRKQNTALTSRLSGTTSRFGVISQVIRVLVVVSYEAQSEPAL